MTTPEDAGQTLTLERVFNCRPEDLWEAWTDPDQFAQWINPTPGQNAEVHELDVREGGIVHFTMYGPTGEPFPEEEGRFEVVDEPHELVHIQPNDDRDDVFGGRPMKLTARFVDEGSHTRMIFEQTGLPPEFPIDEARNGFGSCFDQLANLVTTEALTQTTDREIVITRVLDADAKLVFEAFTDPDQVDAWWGPDGFTTETEEMTVEEDGLWLFTMTGPEATSSTTASSTPRSCPPSV